MNVKEESEKAGLKLNIQKTKIMALGSIFWKDYFMSGGLFFHQGANHVLYLSLLLILSAVDGH